MAQPYLLYLQTHTLEHTPLIIEAINMSNDWTSEVLANNYTERGLNNLTRLGAEIILLRDLDKALATAAWYPISNPDLLGYASVNFVHTNEQNRKKGYGAIVMHAAERRALEHGFQYMGLSSVTDAVRFYESIGYTNSSKGSRGTGLPWMTKTLL